MFTGLSRMVPNRATVLVAAIVLASTAFADRQGEKNAESVDTAVAASNGVIHAIDTMISPQG